MKWDDSTVVFAVKDYETLKSGRQYDIKGRGDLEYNAGSKSKKGYGFCIEDNENKIWYYFAYKEMDEYFVTSQEFFKSYKRDQKLKSIGI